MASRKISINPRGFTLFEIIIVLALLTAVLGAGLFADMSRYRGGNFHAGRDLLVATLQHARMEAVNNICDGAGCQIGLAHGVHLNLDAQGGLSGFTLFQGNTYNAADPLNIFVDAGSRALSAAGPVNTVFEPFSGDALAIGTIALWSGDSSSTITLGDDGQIFWTQ